MVNLAEQFQILLLTSKKDAETGFDLFKQISGSKTANYDDYTIAFFRGCLDILEFINNCDEDDTTARLDSFAEIGDAELYLTFKSRFESIMDLDNTTHEDIESYKCGYIFGCNTGLVHSQKMAVKEVN